MSLQAEQAITGLNRIQCAKLINNGSFKFVYRNNLADMTVYSHER